jgi:dihydroorotase
VSATVIRNARLLDPASGRDGTGSILVIDGVIAALDGGNGAPSGATMIDCRGHCLAPGIVDMRVQLREPGAEHMENMVSASHAAAAGGITTMAALPNTEPPIDDVALVDFVARRPRMCGCSRDRYRAPSPTRW